MHCMQYMCVVYKVCANFTHSLHRQGSLHTLVPNFFDQGTVSIGYIYIIFIIIALQQLLNNSLKYISSIPVHSRFDLNLPTSHFESPTLKA